MGTITRSGAILNDPHLAAVAFTHFGGLSVSAHGGWLAGGACCLNLQPGGERFTVSVSILWGDLALEDLSMFGFAKSRVLVGAHSGADPNATDLVSRLVA